MSNRTAEASKAIRDAWEQERELVRNGKGTRDWTPEQQQSIIDTGKAYDDDGKAFEGHHMKSAEKYPEYQGDVGNIQFLTRSEHKEAHRGDFRNPTNGYYNTETKITKDFDDDKDMSCRIIQLTEPIELEKKNKNLEVANENNKDIKSITELCKKYSFGYQLPMKRNNGFFNKISEFLNEHPELTEYLKEVVETTGKTVGRKIGEQLLKPLINSDQYNKKNDNTVLPQKKDTGISKKNYPSERSSPIQHDVSGYDKKNGKHVETYKRGGNKK